MRKETIQLVLCFAITLTSFAANAEMEFNKGGTAHPTNAADGVSLRGEEAVSMFGALNVKPTRQDGFLVKTLSLDGNVPATRSVIICSVGENEGYLGQLKSAECYMGKIPQK